MSTPLPDSQLPASGLPGSELSDSSLPGPRQQLEDESVTSEALFLTGRAVRARRRWELVELQAAVEFAYEHGQPVAVGDGSTEGSMVRRRDPMTQPGGAGTPAMRQYAIADLALVRDTHAWGARAILADGLDLVHRLPRTWRVLADGRAEAWVARKVARLTRHLSLAEVGLVDGPVAELLAGGHAASTVLEVCEAKIIEARPEAHAEAVADARRSRYVAVSRSDEHGLRRIIATVHAGDATMVDAVVDRVADILSTQAEQSEGRAAERTRQEWRAEAFGYLARPAELLRLLLDHTEPDPDADLVDDPDTDTDTDADADAEPEVEPEAWTPPVYAPAGLADTVERLHALPVKKVAALLPKTVLFAHLATANTATTAATGQGVVRVEGHAPIGVGDLGNYLGGTHVTVKPVIDLNGGHLRAEAYEFPEAIKDRVWLTDTGDVFPYTTRRHTRGSVDFDHIHPHDQGGPTSTDNCGPLARRHHRWKTHAGYRYRPAGGGRYLWQTPTGQARLVGPRGTKPLNQWQTDLITSYRDTEIYFGDLTLAGNCNRSP